MGDQAAGRDGEPLIHAASNAEQFAHLSPGDRLYVVGQWDEKMLLLGRMDVARLMSQDEAEEYFDEPVYEARHHVVADSCTPERFDRIVPEDVARTLTSERGARIAFASESEYRLLTSSLQPRLWLTEESAHALDRLVDVEPQPSGIKLDLVAELENRSRRRRRPNAAQNRAVERQAMSVATRHYEAHGWSVEDVSAAHSFDLLCTRGNALELYVEVKGSSQSWLDEVVLTRNEVALARRWTVDLAVVTGITFGGTSEKPIASGGTLTVFDSFEPSEGQLAPLAYTYTLPSRAQSIDDHA
jgi:hypothetical protein